MEELVARTVAALHQDGLHPLIVTAAFALDLLCIHPFSDGNGRVARLVTSFLMGQTGYGVGRYVSLEQLIFDTKDDYYDALGASTVAWFDDGRHDLWPWTRYLLERVSDAYGASRSGSRPAPPQEPSRTACATMSCFMHRPRSRLQIFVEPFRA